MWDAIFEIVGGLVFLGFSIYFFREWPKILKERTGEGGVYKMGPVTGSIGGSRYIFLILAIFLLVDGIIKLVESLS